MKRQKSNGYATNQDATAILIEIASIEQSIRDVAARGKNERLDAIELLRTLLEIGSKTAEIKTLAHDIYERSKRG